MKQKEFNLSDKVFEKEIEVEYQDSDHTHTDWAKYDLLFLDDVKEFIRLLKKNIKEQTKWRVIRGDVDDQRKADFIEGEETGIENTKEMFLEFIDKLAGDKLKWKNLISDVG